ncbi:MAG: acyclic terpene utilization AtuA family protein [Planctomycetota bacterium]
MSSIRIGRGSLHHHGVGLLPEDPEAAECVLLDGGPVNPPLADATDGLLDGLSLDGLLDEAIRRLAPTLYLNPELRVVATLAGGDPEAAATRAAAILAGSGNAELPIAVVNGCDVLDRLEEFLAAGQSLRNQQTGEAFTRARLAPRMAALALDAEPVAAAHQQGARLVVVGHADAETLTLQFAGELRGQAAATPLHILLEAGATSRALLRVAADARVATDALGDTDRRTFESLPTRWNAALQAAGLPVEGARCEFAASGQTNASSHDLLLVSYSSANEAKANAGMQQLLPMRYPSVGDAPTFEIAIGPTCGRDYTRWPTSVPEGLVEWSVDVRPARDWLE